MEVIRKLELTDLDQILNLRIAIQNNDLKYIESSDVVITKENLKQKTEEYIKGNLNKKLIMFGYFINEKLAANCGFYIDCHFPTYNNKTGVVGYICNVFTLEEYRNKGYQRKTFNAYFNYAKELGITTFKLSTLNNNAVKMYESFGFKNAKNVYTCKVK